MNITKEQTEALLSEFLTEENGLNSVLQMMLNAMMKSERTTHLQESENNKANGYRSGSVFGYGHQIELRIPRDRLSNFTPTILTLFRNQESYIKEVSFQLYTKGLTTRDVSDVMNVIYGKHYSKSKVSDISQSFYQQMQAWRNRTLDTHYPVIYIDGLHVKLKRGNRYENECFYIILGLKEDFTREVISIVNFPTESAYGWSQVFEELKQRGLQTAGLIVSDGLSGIEGSITEHFGSTPHQKCIVHLQRTLRSYVRSDDKKEIADDFRAVLAPDRTDYTIELAHQELIKFTEKWSLRYKTLGKYLLNLEWQPYFTYLNYSIHIRRMIYTTNWIERFNKSCRRTLKIRGAFPNEESVLALITSTAIEKTSKHYAYPIYNFKFEPKLFSKEKQTRIDLLNY